MHGALVALVAAAVALPAPVDVRPEPQGVALGDPAFAPLPGARADYGRLGGSVYEIEIPARWNGKLVLYMHGYGELADTAEVSPPGIRRYLIGQGYAWGASSFSSTSLIPGRAADETAALWDFFARRYGRPARTYVTGQSMGGAATHVAAERYGNRFDGALALCGAAGQTAAVSIDSDFFAAAAFAAGVTQNELDDSPDIAALIRDRIRPALRKPAARRRFERLMVSLTGGPRPFGREGFRAEEETNWRRSELLVASGIATNRDTVYRLGPPSEVTSEAFNRDVIRYRTNASALRAFLAGSKTSGKLVMPTISLHTTGDGQVPYEQARILQRQVAAAGRERLLVQRITRDAGHCGFTNTEWEAALEALVRWVEKGARPSGHDVLGTDPAALRPRFELQPRPGAAEAGAVPGASRRVVLYGKLRVDRARFDSQFVGAVVRRRDGLVTPCQLELAPVANGRYEIGVASRAESSGCGQPGADIVLWTFAGGRILYGRAALPWPSGRRVRFDTSFSSQTPDGIVAPRAQFNGEIFTRKGRQLPGGTRVEAFVGATRCGVASVLRTGSYSGYVLDVVGPEAIPGCTRGATLSFRVDDEPVPETAVNDPARSGTVDLTAGGA